MSATDDDWLADALTCAGIQAATDVEEQLIGDLTNWRPIGILNAINAQPPTDALPDLCHCGDPECWHWSPSYRGYLYCRPCKEHHRPPECAVDEQGRALRSDGTPWEDLP